MIEQGEAINTGFLKIQNDIVNALITSNLTERELRLALLIIRLTNGCHKRWGAFIQQDLTCTNITPNHAKEVLRGLLDKGAILKNGESNQYRLSENYFLDEYKKESSQSERLRKVIGKNLPRETSQKGKTIVPVSGTTDFPNREVETSQEGNNSSIRNSVESRSKPHGFTSAKDIFTDKFKDTEKIGNGSYKKESKEFEPIDPTTFSPMSDGEYQAKVAWGVLEPDKSDSFNVYLWFQKRGLPAHEFIRIVSEILHDPSVENKGAMFVHKAKEYLKSIGVDLERTKMNQLFVDQLARILIEQIKAEEENPVVFYVKKTLIFPKVIFIPATCK